MEEGLIGSHVNGVGLEDFRLVVIPCYIGTMRSSRIALLVRSSTRQLIDGIAVISLACDEDDIIGHGLDAFALFASGRIE